MAEIVLEGCRPVPIAGYLKALGVLRLLTLGPDPRVRGGWRGERFVLHTRLDEEAVLDFFLHDWAPTPFVAPWNGGGGFFPKDNREAIDALRGSLAARFAPYRQAIAVAQEVLGRLGIDEKASKEQKLELQQACLGRLPDDALEWLRAAFVLTGDGAKYPPLLGTGGNDGRLEFSNNFMQRLVALLDPATGAPAPAARGLLAAALFARPIDGLEPRAIGQFHPASAGGVNAASGFEGDSLVNPWDFVLMLEGAVVLGAGAARRFEHDARGALSYPFTVRAVGAGYGSAAEDDATAARGEIWLPLWERPAVFAELRAVFAEGRAQVGGRTAINGVDFARAVGSLGVDRGLSAFQRFGFLVRNGLAFFVTPLERFEVCYHPRVAHLQAIDGWLERAHPRIAGSASTAPASVRRAWRGLEEAIFALCHRGDAPRLLAVLVALGRCRQALARSQKWALENGPPALPPLSPAWLRDADDGSPELRLAASLASTIEPMAGAPASTGGSLIDDLNAVMARRLLLIQRTPGAPIDAGSKRYRDRGVACAELGDVALFLAGRVDDRRLRELLHASLLIDWPPARPFLLRLPQEPASEPLGALYPLLKLCFAGHELRSDASVPLVAEIHAQAARGDAGRASERAARRLRASGLPAAVERVGADPEPCRRAAAALLFPLSKGQVARLAERVLRPREEVEERHSDPADDENSGDPTDGGGSR